MGNYNTLQGQSAARINMAIADRDAAILGAEAQRQQAVQVPSPTPLLTQNSQFIFMSQLARGQAEALEIMSAASAGALHTVGAALQDGGGRDAAAMRVAESCVDPLPSPYFSNPRDRYVAAIANVAKAGNTMLLPTASNDPAAATAAAMNIFNQASDNPFFFLSS